MPLLCQERSEMKSKTDQELIAELEKRGWHVPTLFLKVGTQVSTKPALEPIPVMWSGTVRDSRRPDTTGTVEQSYSNLQDPYYVIRYDDVRLLPAQRGHPDRERAMKFLLFIKGVGEGCDYTIGCNQKTVRIEAKDLSAALLKAEQVYNDHGGSERIESITLYPGDEQATLDIEAIEARKKAAKAAKVAAAQEAKDRADFERLQAKFGKPT